MNSLRQGVAARRLLAPVLACLTLLGGGAGVSARNDDGVHDFMVTQGHDSAAPAAPAAVEQRQVPRVDSARGARSLTVRLHPRHAPAVRVAAATPVAPGKVSIYEDRTLRPGDAVMTAKGIRVFAGSTAWPYRDDDFVALADAGRMDGRVEKALAEMDRSPRL